MKKIIFFFLFAFFLNPSQLRASVSWDSDEVYDSLMVNEAFIRVKNVMSTYDYNDSSSANHGHILTYGSSSTCNRQPYSVIAVWNEILDSDESSIKKNQGACYTIARFNYSCPGDSVIIGMGSEWNPYDCTEDHCEYYDRSFNFYCANGIDDSGSLLRSQSCTEHPYKFSEVNPEANSENTKSPEKIDTSLTNVTHEKASNKLTCPDGKVLKGIKSWYSKEDRDRRFSISCCEISDGSTAYEVDTSLCEETSESSPEKDFDLSCSSEKSFIYEISSNYWNAKDDRTVKLNCCELKEKSE